MKKILIAVGGSGGHVIPASALATHLKERFKEAEVLFVGGGLDSNLYLESSSFQKKDIVAPKLSLRMPLKIFRGIRESKKIIEEFRPDVVVGFGSYHTFPLMVASAICSVPTVLYAADSVPGKVIRFMSSFAKVSTVHFPEAAKYLRGHKQIVSHPLRVGFKKDEEQKKRAYEYFGLDPKRPILVVFGGSQGALFINELMKRSLLLIRERIPSLQLIHLTGSLKWSEELEVFYKRCHVDAFVRSYENRVDLAWQIADLSVTRAGASTIAEQIAMEVPGILIPFPSAADDHQNKNADCMMWEVKGGIKLLQSRATPQRFAEKVVSCFEKDKEKIKEMKRWIQTHKENTAHESLSSIVSSVIGAL